MGEPNFKIGESLSLRSRGALSETLVADESKLVSALIERARCSEDEQHEIVRLA